MDINPYLQNLRPTQPGNAYGKNIFAEYHLLKLCAEQRIVGTTDLGQSQSDDWSQTPPQCSGHLGLFRV